MPKKSKFDPQQHHPLCRIRVEQRWSMEGLGQQIGVSQTAIRYWEIKAVPLPEHRAHQLAKVLNCNVDELRPFHPGRQGGNA